MHIQEASDPVQVDALLQGNEVPDVDGLPPLPEALDPRQDRPRRTGPPPVLEWPAVPEARSYELQFSLDRFASILFSTDSATGGPPIRTNRYEVPGWAWREAPADRVVYYRVLAKLPDGPALAGEGSVAAQE